ncbi:hypothetical protein [Streptomyces sp. NPDC048191]|uniref:hypothetical protein n=1 Tax=Streptomyces sp. NPDC048191 TaxID=3155484 RepID=UPI0033E3007E
MVLAVLALTLLALASHWDSSALSERSASTLIPTATGFLGAIIVGTAAYTNVRREDRGIIEGRERVRAAERNLEEALRVAQNQPENLPEAEASAQLPDVEELPPFSQELPSPAAERPLASSQLTLPELWAVTHSRMDLYHGIATAQSHRSFRNAQMAVISGFLLLIVFVAVAMQATTTAGSVVAGALGAVSAALAACVSRTFVNSQDIAATHLRAYFDQPLEFARYLAAERLIAGAQLTQVQRAQVLTTLVQSMVTAQTAPPAPAAPNPQQTAPQQRRY